MLAFNLLFALPLAAAHWLPHKPDKPTSYCGTVTATCTSVTRVPSDIPSTSTCVVWGKCFTTATRTQVNCKTEWATKTNTVTRTPTVWVTATPTKTITKTKWETKSVCINDKWKKDRLLEDLEDMNNQERMVHGLPLRTPHQERTWGWKPPPPPGPSCVPTTTTETEWVTRTTPHVITSTSTKCLFTKTSIVPSWSTYTRTKTDCVTTNGPPITKTNPCPTYATATVTATTTKKCWC